MNVRQFLDLRLRNAEHRVSRRLRREMERRRLRVTLDQLTLPQASGSDIPVRRLPPERDVYARIEFRDAVLAQAAAFDADELRVARLYLSGHSPRAVFAALGIPGATGYRKYARLLEQLKEAAR